RAGGGLRGGAGALRAGAPSSAGRVVGAEERARGHGLVGTQAVPLLLAAHRIEAAHGGLAGLVVAAARGVGHAAIAALAVGGRGGVGVGVGADAHADRQAVVDRLLHAQGVPLGGAAVAVVAAH